VADAQAEVIQAEIVLAAAQEVVDEAQQVVDAAQAVVDAILAEIEGTEQYVDELSDKEVFAYNRAFNNAIQTDLLPLDIDLDLLNFLAENGNTNRDIQLATNGFESEARFMRKATWFEAKAESTGKDHFYAKADRARAKGAAQKAKFLDKVGADLGSDQAKATAKGHAKRAARAQGR
jgi:hypothetical protein